MIVNNLVDVMEELKIIELSGGTPSVEILLYKADYVERGESKAKFLLPMDAIKIDVMGVPKISESLRRDVYNFYNTMVTNDLNNYLLSTVTNVKARSESDFSFDTVVLTDYSEDIKDLLAVSKKAPQLDTAISNFNYKPTINELDSDETKFFNELLSENDLVLPLIHVNRYNVIMQPVLPLKSKALDAGSTLELIDADLLGISNSLKRTDSTLQTILIDSDTDKLYLITTINGVLTIRRIQSDWLTAKNFIK